MKFARPPQVVEMVVGTHVRVADAFVAPLVLGIFAWGGLYLRDEPLRALLPFRKPAPG